MEHRPAGRYSFFVQRQSASRDSIPSGADAPLATPTSFVLPEERFMARQMLTRCLDFFSDFEGFGLDHVFVEDWVLPDLTARTSHPRT